MRGVSLLLAVAALASCTTAPEQATRTPEGQREFARLTAGKVMGPPQQCVHSFETRDMVPIDDSTLAYRNGSRVYIAQMKGICTGLGRNSIMVVRHVGNSDTCNGDIAEMVDSGSRMMTGSCAFGEFIPYAPPR